MIRAYVVEKGHSCFAVSTNLADSEERLFKTANGAIEFARSLQNSGAVSALEVHAEHYTLGGELDLDADDQSRILELWDKGAGVDDIAGDTDIAEGAIADFLRSEGFPA